MKSMMIACVCAIAAMAATATSYAAKSDRSGRTTQSAAGSAHVASGLVAKELKVLTDKGLSATRAQQALGVQSRVTEADLPSRLQAAMGDAYAGLWFDNAAARLQVGVTSPAGRRAAEAVVAAAGLRDAVVFTRVRSTAAELLAAQGRWNAKLASLFAREEASTSIQPQHNAVVVELGTAVPAGRVQELQREASADSVAVLVTPAAGPRVGLVQQAKECENFEKEKENANCNPSITAGVEIWSKIKCKKVAKQVGEDFYATQKECEEKKAKGKEGEWEREEVGASEDNPTICSAGPAAIPLANMFETVLLTAGHCIESGGGVGIEWQASKRNLEEPVIGKAIEFKNGGAVGAKIGDFGDIRIEAAGGWQTGVANDPVLAVTAEWKRAEETRYKVKGERAPMVKAMNCHEGRTTGEECGEITALNVSITVEEKTAEGLVEDTAEAAGGDSGGAWLFVPTEGNPNHEAFMEGTHVGEKGSTENAVYEPLKKVEAGAAQGSLEVLKLELLTTANEVRAALGGWDVNGTLLFGTAALLNNLLVLAHGELIAAGTKVVCTGATVGITAGELVAPDEIRAQDLTFSNCTATAPCTLASETILTLPVHGLAVLDGPLNTAVSLLPLPGNTFTVLSFLGETCALKGAQLVTGTLGLLIHQGFDPAALHLVLLSAPLGSLKVGPSPAAFLGFDGDLRLASGQTWNFL
jgi:hypothetical protein